ncbi:MAG: T9SS type A sorting domain-containing protein, partial [Bacteroidia bacterium]
DLNGKGINLTGNGGNILVSGGSRNIINSSVTASNINVSGSKTVTSASSGTLNIGNNIRVALTSAIDFGSSLTTIDGTLAMLPSGVVNSNAPIYSNTSTLEYTTGTTASRGIEWSSTSGAGYPNNVNITANVTGTTLNLGTGTASPTIAGALTIAAGCTVNMQALASPLTVYGNISLAGVTAALTLSSTPGGNLLCGGNLSVGGATITHNSREVEMMGTSGIQDITGISSFDYLKINNSGTSVRLNDATTTINNRLWLNNGLLDLNAHTLNIANNALLRRSSSAASMNAIPTPISAYDLQYDATMNSDNEFVSSTTAIRNLEITAGTLSLAGNRTINNNLVLSGGNLNLGTNTFTTYGNATAPSFAGNISVSGGGSRLINGAGNFNITGAGANNPTKQTKQFTNTGGTTLTFASGVTVNIGDGQVDFGAGNPVTINGTLLVLTAGSVGSSLNACNYGVGSTLLFDNGVDYTITSADKTWNLGSSGAGVPYNVTINGLSTDVYLNDDRTIRNNLTIVDAKLHTATMTNGISVKGNWTRSGASSAFDNAANAKVTFNGTSSQTINVGVGITNETFYDLALNNAAGVKLGSNTDLIITNQLNFISGVFDIGTSTNNITIDGTITGGNSLSYINTNYAGTGSVRKSATTNTSYTFPVGDETNYTPISITLYSGAQLGTYLNAKVIAAPHPQLGSGQTGYLNRYWSIEQSGLAPGFAYGADFSYAQSDVIGSEATIFPYKWTPGTGVGTGWIGAGGSTAEFQMGSGSVDMVLNTMHWEGIYSFSDITGSGGGTPLPITLVNFDAVKENKKVKLSWTTYSEINNDFFTVEKTTDGINFKAIETLDGAGNHNGILNYSTEDNNPEIGKNYYRLKQTDFNGKYEYSKLVMVEFMQDFTKSISLHPNPSNGQDVKLIINGITSENLIQLKLFSSNGSQVFSENSRANNGSNPILIPTKNLSNGIYYLQINIDGSISTIKLVVVNN